MPRESAHEKGRRYLTEGRLYVREASAGSVSAVCRGGGEVYELGYSEDRGWWCFCPAIRECAHLVALQLVCVPVRSPLSALIP